ncbi:MAG: tRNA1(Val) (adenine(37)-N6)-methyltransferase [Ferruginibacter sp.]
MKVSTVACLFAAWTRSQMLAVQANAWVLDVGAGTGLLSLFLAQDTPFAITALEIDAAAVSQCEENFNASPFSNRLNVFEVDASRFKPEKKADWIICNPPFYEDDLPSPDPNRNRARHQESLTYRSIARQFRNWVSEQGVCAVLMPFDRVDEILVEFQQAGWHVFARMDMKNTPNARASCSAVLFKIQNTNDVHAEVVIIREEPSRYSNVFIELLKPYYLNL